MSAAAVVERMLAAVAELAPAIASRAVEIEVERRISLDLVEVLRSVGVFPHVRASELWGLELDLPKGLEIIGALSKIDGSVGWTAMIGSTSATFAPLLPRGTHEQIYRNGPDVIIAGSTQSLGTAEAMDLGWKVNGRWPFASGCQHSDWLVGLCIITEGGRHLPGPAAEGGPPLIRAVFLWRTIGRSRTLGMSQAFRVREAITSRFTIRWFPRRIFLISRTACHA
jgi:alkylation response protein AidB-like acyl-CoA dehydrogenase